MSTTTANYKLIKPALTDPADITALNQNWDTIDSKLADLAQSRDSIDGDISIMERRVDYAEQDIDELERKTTDLGQTVDYLDNEIVEINRRNITDLYAIGLTPGSETINEIALKLPNYSRLVLTVAEGMNSSIYPDGNYGLLIVEKTINSRVLFTFVNNQGKEWVGVFSYTTNGTTWTDWCSSYNENTKLVLTKYTHYGNSLPSEGTAGQLFFLKA